MIRAKGSTGGENPEIAVEMDKATINTVCACCKFRA